MPPSRKRNFFAAFEPRNHTSPEPTTATDDESTDFKLALLASLQPDLPPSDLLELLLTCNGSVERASELLTQRASKRRSSTITTQSSLASYISTSSSTTPSKIPFPLPPVPKFKTLHLTTPSQVPFHAPATLHPSFLPTATATKLLTECLAEAPTFGRYEFRLFERNVSSPHTAAFYVKDEEMATRHRNSYMYNGSALADVRLFTPTMTAITPLVERHVNNAIRQRVAEVYPHGRKLKYMLPDGGWHVTSAFMNCYDGARQSVGWHSDQLTYLGPRTVIASLSLGVEREFRLRRVAPVTLDPDAEVEAEAGSAAAQTKDSGKMDPALQNTGNTTETKKDEEKWQSEGQVSIHLPHNSLLVMHAECQESWKHSVYPAPTIAPHPLAGGKRINITFRCYRRALTPDKIPRCKCGVTCVLKAVQRVPGKMGRYFWGCQVGNQWKEGDAAQAGREEGGCGYLLWARFDDDGEPVWE
ncbi:hypothetical protein DRE_04622 [Drechslerella stenobrocha 248]|uniref:Fe2OG dioxygenase domain-containing protein n=1 Tax=Drechslerella stenobrocha 248 TaxID=1043628 RepID=W7I1F4_9PEZI|nr:hypothetical protein DRE_04622 [Drechslerella stenobrocha 248]